MRMKYCQCCDEHRCTLHVYSLERQHVLVILPDRRDPAIDTTCVGATARLYGTNRLYRRSPQQSVRANCSEDIV